MERQEKKIRNRKIIGALAKGLFKQIPIIGDLITVIGDKDQKSPEGSMNWPKFLSSLVRYAIILVISYLMVKGTIDEDQAEQLKVLLFN